MEKNTSAQSLSIKPHWWRKTLAGFIGGYALAVVLVGLFAWFGPGGIQAADKVQFNMWMITPLWLLFISLTYLFRTGNRALFFMLLANVIGWSLFLMLRSEFPL